jgi:hypothetical protein
VPAEHVARPAVVPQEHVGAHAERVLLLLVVELLGPGVADAKPVAADFLAHLYGYFRLAQGRAVPRLPLDQHRRHVPPRVYVNVRDIPRVVDLQVDARGVGAVARLVDHAQAGGPVVGGQLAEVRLNRIEVAPPPELL